MDYDVLLWDEEVSLARQRRIGSFNRLASEILTGGAPNKVHRIDSQTFVAITTAGAKDPVIPSVVHGLRLKDGDARGFVRDFFVSSRVAQKAKALGVVNQFGWKDVRESPEVSFRQLRRQQKLGDDILLLALGDRAVELLFEALAANREFRQQDFDLDGYSLSEITRT